MLHLNAALQPRLHRSGTLRIMLLDLGDVTAVFELRVKGLPARRRIVWHLGAPRDTVPSDRVVQPKTYKPATGRIDVMADLMADQKAPLQVEWTDELGNPVSSPANVSSTFTTDAPDVVSITTDPDGVTWAAAVGPIGTATVHGEFTADGTTVTGDLQIMVVAGLAERANITLGTPEETTPDL